MTEDETFETIPRDVLTTLFRALVWTPETQLTREEHEKAWAWLEQHNHYEEMGQ